MTDFTGARVRLQVEAPESGQRLDQFLARHLADHSRTAVCRWIDEGAVTVDGRPARTSRRLRQGEEILVTLPPPAASQLIPEKIPLDILFEDEHILVLSKAAGMVVHPGAGVHSGTLVHALLARGERWSTIGGVERPGIVHRLDRTTSGVMVVARTDAAHRHLSRQFSQRQVDKTYRAVVHGRLKARRGLIDAPIGRHATHRARMAVRDHGRSARTRYRVVREFPAFSELTIELLTGRTHQIRVHFSELGHPLLGDRLYGKGVAEALRHATSLVETFPRVALHAERLAFTHPVLDERVDFTAPLPDDFRDLLHALEESVA